MNLYNQILIAIYILYIFTYFYIFLYFPMYYYSIINAKLSLFYDYFEFLYFYYLNDINDNY